jgi:hypothetical protein
MTEHLTHHDTEHPGHAGPADAREPDTAEVPGQHRADFREPGTEENPATPANTDNADNPANAGSGAGHNLSTADLASAAAQPADSRAETTTPAQSGGDVETPPLIDEEKVSGFRDRWQNVQTGFVDDPKQAVREADELVAAVISALATTFAEHKSELEGQWQQGEPATEELRIALRRYRSFFDQLLPR